MIESSPGTALSAKLTAARWLSIAAHPFVLIGFLVATASARVAPAGDATRVTALVLGFVIAPIAILIIRQRRRGHWNDVDASRKADRPILFAVAAAGLLALLIYLRTSGTHAYLLHGTVVVLVMLAVCAALTRWIKVSLHLACAALTAATLLFLGSPVGWIVVALLAPLAWSRIALGRHSLLETIAGTIIGLMAGTAVHYL